MKIQKIIFFLLILFFIPCFSSEHEEKRPTTNPKGTPSSSPRSKTIASAVAIKAPLSEDALTKNEAIKKLKDQEIQEGLQHFCKNGSNTFPHIVPGWTAQVNFQAYDHIQGEKILQDAITKHRLDQVAIVEQFSDAKHYKYHSANKYKDADGFLVPVQPLWVHFVVRKEVKENKEKITLAQTQQLYQLAKATCWKSILHSYVKTASDQITIIHTPAGFGEKPDNAQIAFDMLKEKQKFDDESVAYLQKELATTQKKETHSLEE